MLPFNWTPLPEDTSRQLVAALVEEDSPHLLRMFVLTGQETALPFYKDHRLVSLRGTHGDGQDTVFDLYALWRGGRELHLLTGTSTVVHDTNQRELLRLEEPNAADYLRFFLFAMQGPEGSFILLEHPLGDERIDDYAKPLTQTDTDEQGHFYFETTIIYNRIPYNSVFMIKPDGFVEMLGDEALSTELLPEGLPPKPQPFDQGANLRACLRGTKESITYLAQSSEKRGEKPALFLMVELMLEMALQRQKYHRLLDSFNTAISSENILARFATLMSDSSPIVVVESQIPFVEEVIADVVRTHSRSSETLNVVASREFDDGSISVDLNRQRRSLVLLPLQIYRRVQILERIAHELAVQDHSALIACDSFSQLPEALRQLVDITLRLPAMEPALFATLFERVLGASPPAGWQGEDDINWVRHVLHTDFEHPRRMGMPIPKAYEYIRAQVRERVATVDPGTGLKLEDLHGLGEARQHALDLIADIHAAMGGRVPWTQVDRGMLLVGPPGTGKTTLALAIARECGVKFISASASDWQTAGDSLGPHLRAIRATFAEARRYAPSILFIDEIDGLGNREQFSGHNAQYLTEVVNAVLEQIQGMDPSAPVFVIAATNHEERVDPALKRAGRLDRIIRIPRPGSDALDKIYGHYLSDIQSHQPLDTDIDTHQLGRLSLGLTGADVERVVRGAARRARKKDRPLSHADLFDELTHKPRTWDGHIRMSPREIERIALHEAGHALAMYLSASHGDDIGYVSIIPREDGKLGFVAGLPDERAQLTKRDYEEWLEVVLAGRAAEEIRYGLEEISGGCSSDLEHATRLALRMITQLGLGASLTWLETPGEAERRQAEGLLNEAYSRVLGKLRGARDKLDRLTEQIIARQDLDGDAVRGILCA